MTLLLEPTGGPDLAGPGTARPETTTRRAAQPAGFRPDIEGLRGLALLVVLAFHAAVPGFDGGFVGLDAFFVISGYLITGQLLREIDRTGTVRLGAFFARRVRRLLPAACVVICGTAIAAYLVLPTLRSYRLTGDLVSSVFYYANWHFIGQGNNYLATTHGESAAQHYWSLSVEEQFYVLWPVLLLATAGYARWRRRSLHGVALTALGVLTAASFAVCLVTVAKDPGLAYMGTHTRAWQFAVGGLLALAEASVLSRGISRVIADLVGIAGIAAITVALVNVTRATPYPSTAALAPTLGAVAVVLAGPGSVVGRLLAIWPLRIVGRWSYGWYLWHWPILVLVEDQYGPQTWQVNVALMGVAGVLAALTYLLIERPVTLSATLMRRMPAAASLGVISTVITASVVLALGTATARTLGTTNLEADSATFAQVFGSTTNRDAGPVRPSPLSASADLPNPPDCIIDHTAVQKDCTFGAAGGRKVVLVGDSHAHQWQTAFQIIAKARGWQLTVIAKAGCPIADIPPRPGDTSRLSDPTCPLWRSEQLAHITALKPDLIIASNLRSYIPEANQIAEAWDRTLGSFRQSGAQIVYLRDTPAATFDIPECVADSLTNWSRCAFPAPTVTEPIITGIASGRIRDVKVL
ncbi:MAG: putative acyltransferase, partial [Marmoricola sp.]|nr:putative acyltransferase [Marmoricola sp.]